jgi:hypothetical protein
VIAPAALEDAGGKLTQPRNYVGSFHGYSAFWADRSEQMLFGLKHVEFPRGELL